MTDLDRDIAELEARLRHLKKLRKSERISKALTGVKRSAEVRQRMSEASRKAWADPEFRQRMSEARKKTWAEKYEAELAPKRKRETRKGLPPVPRDPFEALLSGGGAR